MFSAAEQSGGPVVVAEDVEVVEVELVDAGSLNVGAASASEHQSVDVDRVEHWDDVASDPVVASFEDS